MRGVVSIVVAETSLPAGGLVAVFTFGVVVPVFARHRWMDDGED